MSLVCAHACTVASNSFHLHWILDHVIVSFSRSDHYEERGVDVKEGGGGGDDEEERQKIKQAQREAVRDFVVRDGDGWEERGGGSRGTIRQ